MKTARTRFTVAGAVILLGAVIVGAVSQQSIRAPIESADKRKPAPAFHLLNASGKAVSLSDFRGKIVLLDFWATDCGGCKLEIPWYTEFDQAYRDKGLAVVGVSVDILYEDLKSAEEGWGKVKPFVQQHKIKYPILMADDAVTKAYSIEALPATYLIDKQGRIAAPYVGLVDKNNMEENIKTLLMEH
jgi:peroxiredoxin